MPPDRHYGPTIWKPLLDEYIDQGAARHVVHNVDKNGALNYMADGVIMAMTDRDLPVRSKDWLKAKIEWLCDAEYDHLDSPR